MTLVFRHPGVPMTAEYVVQLLKPGTINVIAAPPSFLEGLAKDPSELQNLAKLKHVSYGGGPLRPEIGNVFSGVLRHLFSLNTTWKMSGLNFFRLTCHNQNLDIDQRNKPRSWTIPPLSYITLGRWNSILSSTPSNRRFEVSETCSTSALGLRIKRR